MALGEFEQVVLLAALHLAPDAYGVEVKRAIEARTGRQVSRTALYITFDRLESKNYLQSELRLGPAVRRGKLRRYITVTPTGLGALRDSRAVLSNMWRGLESIFGEEA